VQEVASGKPNRRVFVFDSEESRPWPVTRRFWLCDASRRLMPEAGEAPVPSGRLLLDLNSCQTITAQSATKPGNCSCNPMVCPA
jgi:hypothetical protein